MKKATTILFSLLLSFAPIFSYGEIYAQSGYEEGQDGILLLTTNCPGVALEAGFKQAFIRADGAAMSGCYVQNDRGNFIVKWENGSIVEVPSNIFTIKENKTSEVKKLIEIEEGLNDQCRGGSGDDPKTESACDEREKILDKLKGLGWCWGPESASGSEKDWVKCGQ